VHGHYEIFWIKRGSGVLCRGHQVIEVSARSLVIVAPSDVHHWLRTKDLEVSILRFTESFMTTVDFRLDYFELRAQLQAGGSWTIQLSDDENSLVDQLFGFLNDSAGLAFNERNELLGSILLMFTYEIRSFHARRGQSIVGNQDSLTVRFKLALEAQCPPLTSVNQFSRRLGVSRSHLQSRLARTTGRSPSDFIHKKILFESKRLLLHTNESSEVIGKRLGFRSPSYFAIFFKRYTNQSPRSFRIDRISTSEVGHPTSV